MGALFTQVTPRESSYFKATKLYSKLQYITYYLFHLCYVIIGNYSHGVSSFLIPPFNFPHSKTPEDVFNFDYYSARITVECAFGELTMR